MVLEVILLKEIDLIINLLLCGIFLFLKKKAIICYLSVFNGQT